MEVLRKAVLLDVPSCSCLKQKMRPSIEFHIEKRQKKIYLFKERWKAWIHSYQSCDPPMVASGALSGKKEMRGRRSCRPGLGTRMCHFRQIGFCPLRIQELSNILKEADSINSIRKAALGTLSSGSESSEQRPVNRVFQEFIQLKEAQEIICIDLSSFFGSFSNKLYKLSSQTQI